MRDGGAGKQCKRAVQIAGAMICKYGRQIRTANTRGKCALQCALKMRAENAKRRAPSVSPLAVSAR